MRFTPKSEEELKKESNFSVFPKGEYDFEIRTATDKISKNSGAEMIELNVDIFAPDGSKRGVFDYLLESALWKLHHCAQACGLEAEYDKGQLEAWMFEGKTGRCKVAVSPASGDWPERNKIVDYIVIEQPIAKTHGKKPVMADLDDDIPF